MAHFRGTVKGARGVASRLGHFSLITRCDGWDIGVACEASRGDDGDSIRISLGGGSNGRDEGYLEFKHVQGQGKMSVLPHIRELRISMNAGHLIAATDANVAALLANEKLRARLLVVLWPDAAGVLSEHNDATA